MKWITHQTAAALLSLALELPTLGIVCAVMGSVLPDMVDQRISSLGITRIQKQKIFNRIHRGNSHWFGWWLGLVIVILICPAPIIYRDALAGLCLGALSHVCLDMLTPQGVPLLPFSRKGRFSFRLCSTGRASEYIFLLLIITVGIMVFGKDLLRHISSFPASIGSLWDMR